MWNPPALKTVVVGMYPARATKYYEQTVVCLMTNDVEPPTVVLTFTVFVPR